MPFHSEITVLLFMVAFLSPYALWAPKCHIYIMHLRAWDCAGLNKSLWFELNDTHLHYLAEVMQMKRVGKSKTNEIWASFTSSFCFLIYGAVRYIFPAGHWFQLSLSGTSNTVCQAQFKLNQFWCHLPPPPPRDWTWWRMCRRAQAQALGDLLESSTTASFRFLLTYTEPVTVTAKTRATNICWAPVIHHAKHFHILPHLTQPINKVYILLFSFHQVKKLRHRKVTMSHLFKVTPPVKWWDSNPSSWLSKRIQVTTQAYSDLWPHSPALKRKAPQNCFSAGQCMWLPRTCLSFPDGIAWQPSFSHFRQKTPKISFFTCPWLLPHLERALKHDRLWFLTYA